MNQVLNFLLVAALAFPSLGILFETMSRSKHDMCYFTTIVMFLFMSFVATCNMLFGYRASAFSNIPQSSFTCLQMMFGEYFYRAMFEADPEISAFIFVVFVYIFTFVTINMYIAIVMRTYIKLREHKMYLSQAMARLFYNETKTNLLNIFNLLFCQNT